MDLLKFLALLLYIVQIFVNIFYGQNIGKISNSLNLDISPSNWVFSIWLIIYSSQLYMLLNIKSTELIAIFIPHALTVLFNISWIFSFINEKFGLATIFIIGLLASILFILVCKKAYLTSLTSSFYHLYFGWVSIASFLGLFTWLLADFSKYYNLIWPFVLYSITILGLVNYNLFTAIPFIIVYSDLLFKKIFRINN